MDPVGHRRAHANELVAIAGGNPQIGIGCGLVADGFAVHKLTAEMQHECRKTAQLRKELAERAEEMVRTHVQLRDVKTELDVSQVGSDVVIDQIDRLTRERDDLNTMVEALRRELDLKSRDHERSGLRRDLLVDY